MVVQEVRSIRSVLLVLEIMERALTSQLQLIEASFCIGSHGNLKPGNLFMSYEDAISSSDVIFLTIPPHAYENVVESHKDLMAGKIIVDVSNLENKDDPCNALRLQSMLPLSYVIKALNTVSAYTLENGSYGASRDTYVCGGSKEGKEKVMQLMREIGLNPIDKGGLRSAVMIEKLPFRFFPGWDTAWLITTLTLLPILLYSYLHFFWYKGSEVVKKNRDDIGLYMANRVIAWAMFWVLSLTYLPGILSGFFQLYRDTKYSRFPSWLDKWLKCRKQLGLICLLFASMHACMSCLLMGAGEVKHMVKNQKILTSNNSAVVLYQLLNEQHQFFTFICCLSSCFDGHLRHYITAFSKRSYELDGMGFCPSRPWVYKLSFWIYSCDVIFVSLVGP